MFSAIDTPTVPVPDWLAPDVIVANAALDVAVHAQPVLVVTPTDALRARARDAERRGRQREGARRWRRCGVGVAGDLRSEHDAHSINTTNAIGTTTTHGSRVVALVNDDKLSRSYSARKVTAGSTEAAARAGK